jgi:hypothetical protein
LRKAIALYAVRTRQRTHTYAEQTSTLTKNRTEDTTVGNMAKNQTKNKYLRTKQILHINYIFHAEKHIAENQTVNTPANWIPSLNI